MRWESGKKHSPEHDNRQSNQAPASYTIVKDGNYFVGEANAPGLSDITANTNPTTVIQAAHDALTSGGKIHLKGHTDYSLETGLSISNAGITFDGEGYTSKITQGTSKNIPWLIDVTGKYFCFKNLRLEGNYTENSGSGGLRIQSTASYHHVLNSYLWHCNTYCLFDDANNARISHNYIAEANYPLFFGAADSVIDNNEIGGGQLRGVYFSSAGYLRFVGNKVFTCGEYLLYGDTVKYTVISDNIFGPSTTYDGIFLTCGAAASGKYNIISDNDFYSIGRDAIRFNAAEMKYNTVCNNIMESVTGYGFWTVTAGADYNQIVNNKLVTCGNTIGIQGGENTIVQGNVGYNPIGKVVNCFDTTNKKIELSGDAAAPGESGVGAQKFTVCNADILISSTDSGGADCDIQIYDPSDNALLQATLSTIDHMHVPVGYKIDWGVYSGAEPTVTVMFI